MRLPAGLRDAFRRHGARGGRARAARLTAEARQAAASRAAAARWIRKRFGAGSFEALGYPGGAAVDAGLDDLAHGRATVESLVVSIAAPRLRREGVPISRVEANARERLMSLLARTSGDLAHARYGAHLRRIASFADACRRRRLDGV